MASNPQHRSVPRPSRRLRPWFAKSDYSSESSGSSRSQRRLRGNFSPKKIFPKKSKALSDSWKQVSRGVSKLFDADNNSFAHKLCLIMALVSIVGFVVDVVVLALPLQLMEAAWRTEVLGYIADRSLVLLFGLGLLAFALQDNFLLRKPFSRLCLLIGLVYLLLCIPMFQGVVSLRQTAQLAIGQQKDQALEQIQAAQNNLAEEGATPTPEEVTNATRQIGVQADQAERNAVRSLYKSLAGAIGNLLVAAFGAIALSRLLS